MSEWHMGRHGLVYLLLSFCLTSSSLAQNPLTVQHPPNPSTDNEQFIVYWTSETGWMSELQLRNNLIGQDLTVTPSLRLADGNETALAPVTIKPQEVKSVDLNAAIFAAAAPQLLGTYGSVVLRYHSFDAGNLYAALMVHNIGHPFVFHIDAIGQTPFLEAGSREGVWWLPKETTTDYLVLTNQGNDSIPVEVSLYGANGKEAKQRLLVLGPRQTNRYSIRKLVQVAGFGGSYGGIKVSTSAHAGSLDTLHVVFDETAGFSAVLKMFDHNPGITLEERDFARTSQWTTRAPMLALSNPDPALVFPAGTIFRPQLFIRNTTGKFADAALRFGKVAGPVLRLNPYETRRIDVAAFEDGTTLPKQANWTTVTLTTKGLPNEIMAVASSYDDTLRYGAQTPFSDQLSFQWEGGMWEYDAQHDSIITAGNGGTKTTQAAFTIFYNQGTEKYELEQTLQPDEQMWIDVGKLIREHIADKNGKTLPANLTSGSYEFRDLMDHAIGSLFEGKVIYDKTYGHVTYGCALCCTLTNSFFSYDPLNIPYGSTAPNYVNAWRSCDGFLQDVTSSFNGGWTTANTNIATVNSVGTFTGVSVGTTTTTAVGYLTGRIGWPACPLRQQTATGSDTVIGPPDHLVVVADQQGASANCPSTGVQLRQMQMRVVDVNGKTVPNSPSVVEAQNPSQAANSCGTGSPVAAGCAPTASDATFIDNMTVSQNLCNSGVNRSSGCGFTVTSTWSACATSGSNTLWVSPRTTKSNLVTVDGNSTSFSVGTICNSTGCH